MGSASKTFALILTLIIAMSCVTLLMLKPVNAQSIPKPSVPEFTVQYICVKNYVQPTTTTDPYTGQTITQGGYYTQSDPFIKITIKNQPFDKSINKTMGLFYQVDGKGHFSGNWVVITYWLATTPNVQYPTQWPEQDYSSQYTVLEYKSLSGLPIPSQGQMDFQVQAGIGTLSNDANSGHWLVDLYQPDYVLNGKNSGWSDTQTLTISQGSNSTAVPSTLSQIPSQITTPTISPSPTSTSTYTPTSTAASSSSATSFWQITSTISSIVIAILLAVIIFLLIHMRKRSRLM